MKRKRVPYKKMHYTFAGRGTARKEKRGYESIEAAEGAIREAGYNLREFSIYLCDVCGLWHIGHYKDEREL